MARRTPNKAKKNSTKIQDTPFWTYLFNTLATISGVIGLPSTLIAYFNIKSSIATVTIASITIILILISICWKIWTDRNLLIQESAELKEKVRSMTKEKKEVETKFNKQSERYYENIQEINNLKQIVYAVKTIVYTYNAGSKDSKQLIETIKYSIEEKIREGEK